MQNPKKSLSKKQIRFLHKRDKEYLAQLHENFTPGSSLLKFEGKTSHYLVQCLLFATVIASVTVPTVARNTRSSNNRHKLNDSSIDTTENDLRNNTVITADEEKIDTKKELIEKSHRAVTSVRGASLPKASIADHNVPQFFKPIQKLSEKLIFCPPKIDCPIAGNQTACTIAGDNVEYWGNMIVRDPKFPQATYSFSSTAMQNLGASIPYIDCQYVLPDPRYPTGLNYITLSPVTPAVLTPVMTNNTAWKPVSSPYTNLLGVCEADSTFSCPFVETPGVLFYQSNPETIDIVGNINNLYFPHQYGFLHISDDKTLQDSCQKSNPCIMQVKIGLQDGTGRYNYFSEGQVSLDPTNNMRILNITASDNAPYNMTQVEPFNTILLRPR